MSSQRDKPLSTDDRWVWRQVAATVRPIQTDYDSAIFSQLVDTPSQRPQPVFLIKHQPPLVTKSAASRPLPELAVGQMPGLDRRTAQRVTRGIMCIEGRIDLHGLTRDQAISRLQSYVDNAFSHGKRTILVITGKGSGGSGVLKAEVPRWLNMPHLRDKVLGFSHAQPKDGGEGALYVLLKRHRT